jgi:hypothetical protein
MSSNNQVNTGGNNSDGEKNKKEDVKKLEEQKKLEEAKKLEEKRLEEERRMRVELPNEIKLTAFNSMKTILSARKFEDKTTKQYADFITDDILDKLILKYSKTHSFTVVVFLSSSKSQCVEHSKGFIGVDDLFIKTEYSDENWICYTLITFVQKSNRDPKRKTLPQPAMEKMDAKVKKLIGKEMTKFLVNKTWDLTNPQQDCNALVDNILDKLTFKYEEYYFAVNCLLRNDDAGYTAYSNSYFFFPKEDSTCFEIFKNDDEKVKNSLFCTVYTSYFKFK